MATIVLPSPPPDASATVKGLVNLTAQTFAGVKTFSSGIVVAGSITVANFTFSGDVLDLNHAGSTITFGGGNAIGLNVASGITGMQFLGPATIYPGTTLTGALGGGSHIWNNAYVQNVYTTGIDNYAAGAFNIGTGLATAINIGSTSTLGTLNLYAATYALLASNSLYLTPKNVATAGTPTVSSPNVILRAYYWDGATNQVVDNYIQNFADTTTPTSHIGFIMQGSEKFQLNSAGNLLFTGGGVGIDLTSGSQLNIGATTAGSIVQGNAAMTAMTLKAKQIALVGSDVVNGSFPYTNTVNAYTSGAPIFGSYTGGVLKAYVDSNGSFVCPPTGGNNGFIASAAAAFYGYPAAADTVGVTTSVQGGAAGAVTAVAGKQAGSAQVIGTTGPAGTAGLAAGPGGHAWIIAGSGGANNGGGGAAGGYVFLRPGAGTGAAGIGVIDFLDAVTGAERVILNPGGTICFYPIDDVTRTLGGPSNRWLDVYTTNILSGGTAGAGVNGSALTLLSQVGGTGATTGGDIVLQAGGGGSSAGQIKFNDTAGVTRLVLNTNGSAILFPNNDNTYSTGWIANRWKYVYSMNVAINSASNPLNYPLVVGTDLGGGLTNAVATFTKGAATSVSLYLGPSTSAGAEVGWDNTNTRGYFNVPASNAAGFTVGGSPKLWVDTSLNVILGTSTTAAPYVNSSGRMTFPSATGANSTATLSIANAAGGYPLAMSGSSAGTTYFADSGGGVSILNVTSSPVAFTFQASNTPGFIMTGDATAGTGNRILQVVGFANQTVAPLLVKLGATPGGNGDAIELQDSTGYQKWRADILGGMMINADASTAGSTLKSPGAITFQNHYWSTTDHTYQISFQSIMNTVAGPTAYLQLNMNGNQKFTWDQKGLFTARAIQTQQDSASATVAQLKTKDVGGTIRWGADASGLPSLGSVYTFDETWVGINSALTTSGHIPGSANFTVAVSGASTGAGYRADDTTRAFNSTIGLDPGSTAGVRCAVFTTEVPVTPVNETTTMFVWEASVCATSYALGTTTLLAGFFNSLQVAHPFGFGFIFRNTDTQWQYFTDNGTTMVVASTGVTPTASRLLRFRIEYFGAGTYVGTKTVKFYVNGSLVGTLTGAAVTGDTPASGLAAGMVCSNITGGSSPWCCLGQTSFWGTAEPSPFSP